VSADDIVIDNATFEENYSNKQEKISGLMTILMTSDFGEVTISNSVF